MDTEAPLTPEEHHWNEQQNALKRARKISSNPKRSKRSPGVRPSPSPGYKPLSSQHPLLQKSRNGSPSQISPARTPPSQLPRLETPPDVEVIRMSPGIRGAKYDVVPPVRQRRQRRQAFQDSNGYDSWGEDSDSDDEDDQPQYPPQFPAGYPAPMVMYPMMMMPAPTPHRSKSKGSKPKKKVRYRNTPIFLNSRENTIHKPRDSYRGSSPSRTDQSQYRYRSSSPNRTGYGEPHKYPYVSPRDRGRERGGEYDPFDPNQNEILARYSLMKPETGPQKDLSRSAGYQPLKDKVDYFKVTHDSPQHHGNSARDSDAKPSTSSSPHEAPGTSYSTPPPLIETKPPPEYEAPPSEYEVSPYKAPPTENPYRSPPVQYLYRAHRTEPPKIPLPSGPPYLPWQPSTLEKQNIKTPPQVIDNTVYRYAFERNGTPYLQRVVNPIPQHIEAERPRTDSRNQTLGFIDQYNPFSSRLPERERRYSPVRSEPREPTPPPDEIIERHDPLENVLSTLVDEVVEEGAIAAVKETISDLTTQHLKQAAVYDEMIDIVTEFIQQDAGPDIIEEARSEVLLENLLVEEIIEPELHEVTQEIAVEVCNHYSDKKRVKATRELRKVVSAKLVDAFMLDYLLSMTARQGFMVTEGEHANKLFDTMILNTLLEQFVLVDDKKRSTIGNKPLRRHHEKITTDVAIDVIMDELCYSLDEDMLDLDEYEQGLNNPSDNTEPSQLQKWLGGS